MSNRNEMTILKPLPNASQVLTYVSGAAVTANAMDKNAAAVRLVASAACFVEVAGGTASTTTSMYIPAGGSVIVGLDIGGSTGAVVSMVAAAGAILYITPLSE